MSKVLEPQLSAYVDSAKYMVGASINIGPKGSALRNRTRSYNNGYPSDNGRKAVFTEWHKAFQSTYANAKA